MTRKERLTRCYFLRETDRPAVYSRSGFPADDPTCRRLKAYLEARTELKGRWSGRMPAAADRPAVSFAPVSADFRRRVETLRTPRGPLRRTVLEGLKGQPGLHETFFVNNPEEAERFLSLPATPATGETASFGSAVAAMGDRGIVEVALGFNPGGFAAALCGSLNFALLSVTDREVLHRLCACRLDFLRRRVKHLLARGVGPFFSLLGQEYIVPPLHGPADFTDFNTRYDKPLIDLIHEGGGRVHIHSHGAVAKVFHGFLAAGADVLHPVEPPPQGDITAGEAKALARGRMCLEGNIQISRMYEATPAAIRRETEQLMREAFDDRRGLIVSPTASPYIRGQGETCLPRYQAMTEAVLAWRG